MELCSAGLSTCSFLILVESAIPNCILLKLKDNFYRYAEFLTCSECVGLICQGAQHILEVRARTCPRSDRLDSSLIEIGTLESRVDLGPFTCETWTCWMECKTACRFVEMLV